jgi:predicted transcriptional regulator
MTEKEEGEIKEIIKPLLVSRKKIEEKLKELVSKVKPFISIEEETGKVLFNRTDITNKEKIALLLIGNYFAEIGKIISSSGLTMREISQALNLPITTIPAPLGELIRSGYIEKTNNTYKVRPFQIEKILNEIIEKYGEKNDK